MQQHKRRIKLIQPRLQIKLISAFLGVSALSLTLQYILFASSLTALAAELPTDGAVLLERVPWHAQRSLLISFGVLLPVTFFVGVVITFRVAGPLYRFEMFLRQIIRGEKPADCRIRKEDELQEFCGLLNQATAALRDAADEPASKARAMEQAA